MIKNEKKNMFLKIASAFASETKVVHGSQEVHLVSLVTEEIQVLLSPQPTNAKCIILQCSPRCKGYKISDFCSAITLRRSFDFFSLTSRHITSPRAVLWWWKIKL
jgi:hypothetical protein